MNGSGAVMQRNNGFRLTPFQESLLFLRLLDRRTGSFNIGRIWRLEGFLDKEALQEALRWVTARHDLLRSSILYQHGVPHWTTAPTIPISVGSFTALEDEFDRQFDFAEVPLIRVGVAGSDRHHSLLIVMPHILVDDFGLSLFVREFADAYSRLLTSRPLEDAQVVQFAAHARRERRAFEGPDFDSHMDYWRRQLQHASALAVPARRKVSQTEIYIGDETAFVLDAAMVRRIKQACATHRVTPYMLHLAAYAVSLRELTGQDDVVIGALVANRVRPDAKAIIGPLVNTLALRFDFSGNPGKQEVLLMSRSLVLDAFRTSDLPFEIVVQRLKSSRILHRSFRLNAVFDYFTEELAVPNFEGLSVEALPFNRRRSQLGIILKASPNAGSTLVSFRYQSAYFDVASIGKFFELYNTALEALCTN